MKKFLFVIVCMLNTLWASAQFSGSGSGTESDPYLIFNATQLAQMSNFLNNENVVFELKNNIDLTDFISDNYPGEGWTPIGVSATPFKGKLIGNNHTISGLSVNRPGTQYVGLFGNINDATISNLIVEATTIKGASDTGVLAGYAENATISDITIYAQNVSGTTFVGAIAGRMFGTCQNVTVTSNVTGTQYVGGLIGSTGATYDNCSQFGDVNGESCVGGISGYSSSTAKFTDCKSQGNVTSNGDYAGGILGRGDFAEMTNCSHFGNIIGKNNVGGLLGGNDGEEFPVYELRRDKDNSIFMSFTNDNDFICDSQRDTRVIDKCIAIGNIAGKQNVGGLIGSDTGSSSFSLWNVYSEYTYHEGYYGDDNYNFSLYRNGKYVLNTSGHNYFKPIDKRKYYLVNVANSYFCGVVSGSENVGGLVGNKLCGEVKCCYTNASVYGERNVGGLIGKATGNGVVNNIPDFLSIKSSAAININVNASIRNVGRIYGYKVNKYVQIGDLGTVDGNLSINKTSVIENGVAQIITDDLQNGTSIGPAMLQLKATYVAKGWNFDSDWTILETESYPYMRYQAAPPVIESSLVSHATEIKGKSLNGGTVYMYYKDREPVSTSCTGNQWSFTTEELQSGAQVRLYADAEGMTPSYFATSTVKYPGSGTEADPYRIYSAEDLQGMSNAGYYKIMNDIDLSSWISVNSPTAGWSAVGRNSAAATYIDGDDHTITGLWINSNDDYCGLFSNYSAGSIKNLNVKVAAGKKVKGGDCTGILIGRMYNGEIINCTVKGDVEGTTRVGGLAGHTENVAFKKDVFTGIATSLATEANVGGIAGYAEGGTVTVCFCNSTITTNGTDASAGGLLGKTSATISKCHSEGAVTASGDNSIVGGLIGTTIGNVSDCYSTATINGNLYSAGLVGYAYGHIDKCYASGDINGVKYGAGVVGELDGSNAALTNSVAMNNILSLTDQSSWGCRVIGGFKNGCSNPDRSNYALNTMQVSLNGIPQRKTDDNIEGTAKTAEELMSSSFYTGLGWDMTEVWAINEGSSYPYMQNTEEIVLATGIALNHTSITIKLDETATLLATIMPDDATKKSVTWASSNQYVATVENGVVTALATGTTTITATTTDGTDLSASCVVTVSSDASDETTDLEPSTDISVYPNILYFNDVENKAGDFNLKLNMKCAQENITAFQCDVYLLEGVTWKSTTDRRGNIVYDLPTFNEDRTDASYHTIAPIAQNADGSYNIIVYSMDLETILDTDGVLMTLPLEISEDMEAADYNLFIRNIVMTDVDQNQTKVAEVVSRLTIPSYQIGDANGDDEINITDIVAVIAYIRGNAGTNFIFPAADVNADGEINITDIVGIIAIIRNGGASAKPMSAAPAMAATPTRTADNLEVIPFAVAEGTTSATVQLDMNNPGKEFTAFQCDIVFPEGIEWASTVDRRGNKKYTAPTFNSEADRTDASYHTVDVGENADGTMNIMVYSMGLETFWGDSGSILDMPFTFAEALVPGVYDITVKNIVMTDPDQGQVKPEDYIFSVLVGSPAERAVALKGNFTDDAISSYNAALAGNTVVSAIDLTDAVEVSENTAIATGNENLLVYGAEDMAVKNAVNVVKGDECASLVITDGSDFCAPKAFTASSATYERALAAEWGTVMLPYAVISSDAVQYYALSDVDLVNGVLTFEEAVSVDANTPAVFKAVGSTLTANTANVEIPVCAGIVAGDAVNGLTLTGTLAKTALSGLDPEAASGVYYIKDNKFWRGNGTLNIPAFRAYFDASVAGAKALTIFDGEGTDISGISADSEIKVYTIDGKQMNNNIKSLPAGMYIVNDKKIIIKK